MRRIVLIATILTAFAATATAGAYVASAGDGTLSVKNADGVFWMKADGALLGRFDSGSIRVFDPVDGAPLDVTVWGADRPPRAISDTTTVYSGDNLRFRIIGKFRIRIVATNISLSAVGQGKVGMQGDAGTYSFDGKARKPLPTDLDANGNLLLFDLGEPPNPGPGP